MNINYGGSLMTNNQKNQGNKDTANKGQGKGQGSAGQRGGASKQSNQK